MRRLRNGSVAGHVERVPRGIALGQSRHRLQILPSGCSGHESWGGRTPDGNLSSRTRRPGLPDERPGLGQTRAAQTSPPQKPVQTAKSTAQKANPRIRSWRKRIDRSREDDPSVAGQHCCLVLTDRAGNIGLGADNMKPGKEPGTALVVDSEGVMAVERFE